MTGKLQIVFLLVTVFALAGCGNKKPRYKQKEPAIIKEQVQIKRYEKALFELNPDSLQGKLSALQSDFDFFLGKEPINQQQLIRLYDYVTDPTLIDLYDKVTEKYPDNKLLAEDLTKMISYMKAYRPEAQIPVTYTYISGLDYSQPVMFYDSLIIISLDMYLGSNFNGYRSMGIPKYKRAHYRPEYLSVDVAAEIGRSLLPGRAEGKLIERMIFQGKQLYFKDAFLPDKHDSLKIKYTSSQLNWIKNNEKVIWSFIIENELLFSGRYSKYKKLLSDGPFTSEFGRDSAPRIAQWIGWQIVRQYMENNEQASLTDLMQTSDAQQILEKSRYKP